MIDPFTAISAATAAFNGIKRIVHSGRELEDCMQQLGKWYGAAADIRKAKTINKNPPLFKKLFQGGSIEEEALALIIHEKKLQEQEKELETLLNFRFGFGTWKEMLAMRRRIAKERENAIYAQEQRKNAIIDGLLIVGIFALAAALLVGGLWFLSSIK